MEKFLQPAEGIQSDHPRIKELALKITKDAGDQVEAARLLFYFVRDTVAYSVYVPFDHIEDYLALNTLERGRGYCVQKAALLCTLARSVGIPTRLGFADIRNDLLPEHLDEMIPEGILYYHCFVEWFLDGRWIKSTPSFDQALSLKKGWRLVEFDPAGDALLPSHDLKGRPHVSYLKYHGWRLGVPLDEFIEVNTKGCGQKAMDIWRSLGSQAKQEIAGGQ